VNLPENIAVYLPGELSLSGDQYTRDSDVPRQLYDKDLLRIGEFRAEDGTTYTIDDQSLSAIANSTNAYIAAGHESYLLDAEHPTTDGKTPTPSEMSRGNLLSVSRVGDRLRGRFEAVGHDAIAAAARMNVSIGARKDRIGSDSKAYPYAIDHTVLTTRPVVSGLGRFEAIAASNPGHTLLTHQEQTMSIDLKKLAESTGIKDELTADNAVEQVSLAFSNQNKAVQDLIAERDRLKAEADKPDSLALSNGDRGAGIRTGQAAADKAVSHGKCTRALASAMFEKLQGNDDFLRFSNEGRGPNLIEDVFGLMDKHNDAAAMDSLTSQQKGDGVVTLSNEKAKTQRSAEREEDSSDVDGYIGKSGK